MVELADLGPFLRGEGQTGQERGRKGTISAVTLSHSPIMAAGMAISEVEHEGGGEKGLQSLVATCPLHSSALLK